MDSFVNITPIITVLMPVYNCELYIQEAVESILNQNFTDFEFLILDDASTDKTVSIIKKSDDPRIHLIEKPLNTGYTNSLNYGLQLQKVNILPVWMEMILVCRNGLPNKLLIWKPIRCCIMWYFI